MPDPTPSQIQAAYALVASTEKAALTALKEKTEAFVAELDVILSTLPQNVFPQSTVSSNLSSWRATAASMASSAASMLAQYPAEDPAP